MPSICFVLLLYKPLEVCAEFITRSMEKLEKWKKQRQILNEKWKLGRGVVRGRGCREERKVETRRTERDLISVHCWYFHFHRDQKNRKQEALRDQPSGFSFRVCEPLLLCCIAAHWKRLFSLFQAVKLQTEAHQLKTVIPHISATFCSPRYLVIWTVAFPLFNGEALPSNIFLNCTKKSSIDVLFAPGRDL